MTQYFHEKGSRIHMPIKTTHQQIMLSKFLTNYYCHNSLTPSFSSFSLCHPCHMYFKFTTHQIIFREFWKKAEVVVSGGYISLILCTLTTTVVGNFEPKTACDCISLSLWRNSIFSNKPVHFDTV